MNVLEKAMLARMHTIVIMYDSHQNARDSNGSWKILHWVNHLLNHKVEIIPPEHWYKIKYNIINAKLSFWSLSC